MGIEHNIIFSTGVCLFVLTVCVAMVSDEVAMISAIRVLSIRYRQVLSGPFLDDLLHALEQKDVWVIYLMGQ